MKHPLVVSTDRFLQRLFRGTCPVLFISLSGGVDSMVISRILMLLQSRFSPPPCKACIFSTGVLPALTLLDVDRRDRSSSGYAIEKIVGIHIDYANRPESGREAAFVQDWCENRSKYEASGASSSIAAEFHLRLPSTWLRQCRRA
jgi:PP-loop family